MAVKSIPDGMHNAIPHLVVDDGPRAIEFYREAFGAEEIARSPAPDGKRLLHAHLKIGESHIFLSDEFPEYSKGRKSSPHALGGCTTTIHHYVEDCDAAFERAKKAGAKIVMEPQDMFWGDRYGMLVDPFGHRWSFATHIRDVSPEEVSEAARKMFSSEQPA
jgi:uncharacterized glyoxalase superfamily protein PhnB